MSSTTTQDADLKWEFAPGWERTLAECGAANIARLVESGAGQIIKHGVNRTVYRLDLPQRTLFVKHYRTPRFLGALRHVAQASHSRREWCKALEMLRRRVPTAPPVAVVERRHGWLVRDNFYISEAVAGAQSVDEFVASELPRLPIGQQARCKRQLIAALARLAATAHAAGIEHNDLHTGNILLRWPVPTESPELFLIDLPGVRLRRPLDWPRTRASLAMLGGGWIELSLADRHRFWREYLRQREDIATAIPVDGSKQTFAAMRAHACHIAGGRDKRPLHNNRHFQRIQTSRTQAYAVKDLASEQVRQLSQDPALPLRVHRHDPVKIGHGSVVVQARLPLAATTQVVAYKRSRAKTWWKRLLGALRRSRAVAGWQTGHGLLARGIATARPLAAIESRRWCGESYLATAWIDGALNLHLFGWELATCPPRDRHGRACRAAASLGSLLGRMHAWRISHSDLKGCNLVVAEESNRTTAYLLDLDSVRFLRRLSAARQARDLARLAASMEAHPWLSRTVRLRFLRTYLRAMHLHHDDWKPLWRAVASRTRPILARFADQGRPVA